MTRRPTLYRLFRKSSGCRRNSFAGVPPAVLLHAPNSHEPAFPAQRAPGSCPPASSFDGLLSENTRRRVLHGASHDPTRQGYVTAVFICSRKMRAEYVGLI